MEAGMARNATESESGAAHPSRDQAPAIEKRPSLIDSLPAKGIRFLKVLAPLRALGQALVPRGFGKRALIPWQQLEHIPGAAGDTWLSTGVDPQFVAPCFLPAGWTRFHIRLSCEHRARLEVFTGTHSGCHPATCIERVDFRGTFDRVFFIKLQEPVVCVRLDPLDCEGEFRLEKMDVWPVSKVRVLALALGAKLREAYTRRQIVAGLATACSLLMRGRVAQLKEKLLQGLNGPSANAPPPHDPQAAYDAWRNCRALTNRDRKKMRARALALRNPRRFSVLLRLSQGSEKYLRLALNSAMRQTYPHWELCIALDRSTSAAAFAVLEECRRQDPRIRICRLEKEGDAAVDNTALGLATGDFVLLMNATDELAEHALSQLADTIALTPGVDMIYSDEDEIDENGRHAAPFFKPDWSPEYMVSCSYTGHLAAYRASLVRALGGGREANGDVRDEDLALRAAARAARIAHIPDVLYHKRIALKKGAADSPADVAVQEASNRAVQCFLELSGRPATVERGPAPRLRKVRFALPSHPRLSIIIPTAYRDGIIRRQRTVLLMRCLESIFQKSTYLNYEIVVVDNDEAPADIKRDLEKWGVRRAPYRRPFNWSAAMNQGASLARGAHLVFLNDDTEVISADWLEALLEYSQQPDIGAVGARLLFPDGRLQHVGITILDGRPVHAFYGQPADHEGHFGGTRVPRNYSAVTGACLMSRADVFHSVGGFTAELDLNYNDVDYCLKIAERGRRTVYTPYAELYHHEAATKPGLFPHELEAFQKRWCKTRPLDPYYNPNLSRRFPDSRVEPAPHPGSDAF
jgi:GT2 family glycosyltransferase